MEILVKTKEVNLSLMSEDLLLSTIWLPCFLIHAIIVPLTLYRGMNGGTYFIVCILVHNFDNCSSLLICQGTNGGNGNWINLMIIYTLNFYMPVWGRIYYSNILTINPSIVILFNKWLIILSVVCGHVYKWSVNLMIQFFVNREIFIPFVEDGLVLEITFLIYIGETLDLL